MDRVNIKLPLVGRAFMLARTAEEAKIRAGECDLPAKRCVYITNVYQARYKVPAIILECPGFDDDDLRARLMKFPAVLRATWIKLP